MASLARPRAGPGRRAPRRLRGVIRGALVLAGRAPRLAAAAGAARAAEAGPSVLRWGGDAEGGAPFVEADPADPTRLRGFDVEIANLVARKLGRTPAFVQVAFQSLDQSAARGDFDIALSGIEDTPGAPRHARGHGAVLRVPRGPDRARGRFDALPRPRRPARAARRDARRHDRVGRARRRRKDRRDRPRLLRRRRPPVRGPRAGPAGRGPPRQRPRGALRAPGPGSRDPARGGRDGPLRRDPREGERGAPRPHRRDPDGGDARRDAEEDLRGVEGLGREPGRIRREDEDEDFFEW